MKLKIEDEIRNCIIYKAKEGEYMALRVGVIGLGDVSIVHINAIKLSDKAELVAVCDTDETKMNLVEDVNFYTDYI